MNEHWQYQPRTTRRRALAALAVGAVTLTACGRRTPSNSAAKSQSKSNAPRYGGTLNLGKKNDPNTFDPGTKLTATGQVLAMTNDRLIAYKTGDGVGYYDLILQPWLARQWETPDPQVYTFKLNQATFADVPPVNGRAMTAEDAKWSFEYLAGIGWAANRPPVDTASLFTGLEGIEAPDPSTAVFHFSEPFAPFLTYVTAVTSAVLAREVYEQDGSLAKRAVGSGPWQLDMTETQPGQQWVFKKNPSYFQKGLPYIDQVNWLIIPDDAANDAAFQTKQIDVLSYSNLSLDTVDRMKKAVPDVVVDEKLDTRAQYIWMNCSKPPLTDARVRKAIALSIDHDEFVRAIEHGHGQPALASSWPDLFTLQEIRGIQKYDVAQARQLLAAAGYGGGVGLEIVYPPKKYGAVHVARLELLQSQLKRSGINLNLKAVDDLNDFNYIRSGDYQLGMTPSTLPGTNPDLDIQLYALYHPKSTTNYGRVDDPQLTPLLEAQRRELDPSKRRDLWRQAVRRVNEVPWATALNYATTYDLWHPYLKNYAPNVAYVADCIWESWLAK